MNIGLDALNIGPLAISWSSLSLMLGLVAWLGLARFPGAERAALVTLIVARVWAAMPGLDAGRPVLENVLDVLDPRRGDWAWVPGLLAGGLTLWWTSGRELPPRAVPALAATLLAGLAPLLLKPAPTTLQATLPDEPLALLTPGGVQPATPLRAGAVVNFWATWCGPCRAELPLLASAVARGEAIELVNVGESAATVHAFLEKEGLTLPTRLTGERISAGLGVTGFPTTLAVSEAGQIVARHLGPLSGAQLRTLLNQASPPHTLVPEPRGTP